MSPALGETSAALRGVPGLWDAAGLEFCDETGLERLELTADAVQGFGRGNEISRGLGPEWDASECFDTLSELLKGS